MIRSPRMTSRGGGPRVRESAPIARRAVSTRTHFDGTPWSLQNDCQIGSSPTLGGNSCERSLALSRERYPVMTPHSTSVGIALALLTFFPVMTVRAQSARDYLNTPVNAATMFVDLIGSNSETAAESDLPLPNTEAVGHHGAATFLWSFPLCDRYAGVGVTGSYARVKVTGPSGEISTSGFGDPSITFHANIFGSPALRRDQFAQAIPQTFSSFHLTVNAPLGSYDRSSPVNAGANRWAFYPLVNLSITPDKGV